MVINKWDYLLAGLLILSVLFTWGETRIKTNIVQGRNPLDFFGDSTPDPAATWENLPTSRAYMYGIFVIVQKVVTAIYITLFIYLIHIVIKKAGWFKR